MYLKTGIDEIFTECDIFRAHILQTIKLDEGVVEIWILQLFDDTFATREKTHPVVCDGNVLIG